ncbi:COG4223 family protein [Rhodobacter calidifons]|uniref:Inner membrane protein n=1 Tax=Rhodobacter calidifons TaxID=2715277 RepID=A0ABX0G3B9_9RHOB|nr:hypothetical protein [Rhodobacter calidifons]NHB75715.1 hypothetical protein [Rhodobacter calidifons]
MTRRKETPPEAPVEAPAPVPQDPAAPPSDTPEPFVAEPAIADSPSVDPAPEPAVPQPPDPPKPAPQPQRSGVLAPLLGGALAAIGGFALSHFDLLGLGGSTDPAELAALSTRLDETEARLVAALDAAKAEAAAIASRVAALETAPEPAAPDLSRLDDLAQRLAALETAPADGATGDAALAARLADLEQRLSNLPATDASPEIRQQLDAALARLDAAEAEAKARAAEAESAAESARRAKALDALTAAVATGGPFAAELEALADPALTAALGPLADSGVPTLARLQADFPEAAREALRIARQTSAGDSWFDRLLGFLAAQTAARPLTPLEGAAPDAVLSRAEFALTEGRVADALAELATLDPAVQAPFAAWITAANAQVEAATALRSARGE